jgi:hypothetical protein
MIVPNSTFYMMTLEQRKTWHMALGKHFNENNYFFEILISTIHIDYSI